MNNQQGADANLVIDNLLSQIGQLSKDKAVLTSLATQYKQELDDYKAGNIEKESEEIENYNAE